MLNTGTDPQGTDTSSPMAQAEQQSEITEQDPVFIDYVCGFHDVRNLPPGKTLHAKNLRNMCKRLGGGGRICIHGDAWDGAGDCDVRRTARTRGETTFNALRKIVVEREAQTLKVQQQQEKNMLISNNKKQRHY